MTDFFAYAMMTLFTKVWILKVTFFLDREAVHDPLYTSVNSFNVTAAVSPTTPLSGPV